MALQILGPQDLTGSPIITCCWTQSHGKVSQKDFRKHRRTHGTRCYPKALPTFILASLHLFSTQWPEWSFPRHKSDYIISLLRILGHTTLDLKQISSMMATMSWNILKLPLAISSHFLPLFSALSASSPLDSCCFLRPVECSQLTDFCLSGPLLRISPQTPVWITPSIQVFAHILHVNEANSEYPNCCSYNMPTHFLEFPTLLPSLASPILIFPGWHS